MEENERTLIGIRRYFRDNRVRSTRKDVGQTLLRDKLRDFGCGGARRSMDEQVFSE